MRKVLLSVLFISIVYSCSAVNYYSSSSGNIENTSAWSTNTNGIGGSQPGNFGRRRDARFQAARSPDAHEHRPGCPRSTRCGEYAASQQIGERCRGISEDDKGSTEADREDHLGPSRNESTAVDPIRLHRLESRSRSLSSCDHSLSRQRRQRGQA